MSGVCESKMVTRSVSEGLWWPVFWVFRVRIESSVLWEWVGCGMAVAESRGGGGLVLVPLSSSSQWQARASPMLGVGFSRESVEGDVSPSGEAGGEWSYG